jgi:hypothetical protein
MLMCDSRCAGARGKKRAIIPRALVVEGPVPIRALPRPRCRCSSRRSLPPILNLLLLRGLGRKEIHSYIRCLVGALATAPDFLMSPIRLRQFPMPILSSKIRPYPPPMAYVVKGGPL